MFNDLGDEVNKDVSPVYGGGEKWHIYGGHRIWISPEELKTYYPDNHPVAYEITQNGAIFTPQVWNVWDVQSALEIAFTADNAADVKMSLKNLRTEPQRLCIWGLTVLKCGGKLEIPLSTEDTGLLANRNLVLWSYADINDPRFKLENDLITLKSDVSATKPFKLGLYTAGLAAKYKYGDTTFIKRMKADFNNYPDFYCNVETYTSNLIHEVETLSPLTEVAAGDTLTHVENWELL